MNRQALCDIRKASPEGAGMSDVGICLMSASLRGRFLLLHRGFPDTLSQSCLASLACFHSRGCPVVEEAQHLLLAVSIAFFQKAGVLRVDDFTLVV